MFGTALHTRLLFMQKSAVSDTYSDENYHMAHNGIPQYLVTIVYDTVAALHFSTINTNIVLIAKTQPC